MYIVPLLSLFWQHDLQLLVVIQLWPVGEGGLGVGEGGLGGDGGGGGGGGGVGRNGLHCNVWHDGSELYCPDNTLFQQQSLHAGPVETHSDPGFGELGGATNGEH